MTSLGRLYSLSRHASYPTPGGFSVTQEIDLQSLERDVQSFGERVSALAVQRSAFPEDAASVQEAFLEELKLAEAELQACRDELVARSDEMVRRTGRGVQEHRSLRVAFQMLPVPAFMLDESGIILRANVMAAHLLGVAAGYVAGKPLPLFVTLRARAQFRSHLATTKNRGEPARFDTSFIRGAVDRRVRVTLRWTDVPGEDRGMIIAAVSALDDAGVAEAPAEAPTAKPAVEDVAVAAAQRLDLLLGMTRLLLDEESLREPVAMLRAARLLAAQFADWAVIDIVRDGQLRRAAVAASSTGDMTRGLRALEQVGPCEGDVAHDVMREASSVLQPMVEDEGALGVASDGLPILTRLEGRSLLCVPLQQGDEVLGALTVVRKGGRARFDLSDLGLIEEIGEHLALALRTERSYQRRYEIAEVLQSSLLPRTMPSIKGLDVAAVYQAGASGVEVGGDFYDVFDCRDGWGFVLGDVCGKGEEAAAVTARVREGVRLLGLSVDDPVQVLRQVNHAMVTRGNSDRFVTAVFACLRRTPTGARVRLASAGHPPAAILRADGTVQFSSGGGRPLGILDDAQPAIEDIDLGLGDLLLLYSDGATESCASNGDLYGTDGLSDVLARCQGLPAAEVLQTVDADLHAHDGGENRDDVAVLAIRVAEHSV